MSDDMEYGHLIITRHKKSKMVVISFLNVTGDQSIFTARFSSDQVKQLVRDLNSMVSGTETVDMETKRPL